MPEKRALPWLDTPTKEFLARDLRNEKEIQHVYHSAQHWRNGGGSRILFDVVGSRSHIYKTLIGKFPRCSCPDVRFRKAQCKHICFVLSAINDPWETEVPAIILAELRQMLSASSLENIEDRSTIISASQRKPVDGECPICFNDFRASQERTSCHLCGNDVHVACFESWEATIRASKDVVCCIYCKAPWMSDEHGATHLGGEAV